MPRLRWINLLLLGLMAGSLVEPVYGSMRDGDVHHEPLKAAAVHSTAAGDHGHEDGGSAAAATHEHGPDHEHGTSADHCTHQHGTLSVVSFGQPLPRVVVVVSVLAARSQVPPSASLPTSFRPPRS